MAIKSDDAPRSLCSAGTVVLVKIKFLLSDQLCSYILFTDVLENASLKWFHHGETIIEYVYTNLDDTDQSLHMAS